MPKKIPEQAPKPAHERRIADKKIKIQGQKQIPRLPEEARKVLYRKAGPHSSRKKSEKFSEYEETENLELKPAERLLEIINEFNNWSGGEYDFLLKEKDVNIQLNKLLQAVDKELNSEKIDKFSRKELERWHENIEKLKF